MRDSGTTMKGSLILFNGISVAAYLLWLGHNYLRALGSAYGNAHPATGPGDVAYVFVVGAIVTALCLACSFLIPLGAARAVALVPLAYVVLGQGFIVWRQAGNRERHAREEAVRRSAREEKLGRISRDYILRVDPSGAPASFKASFLTHDREIDALVRIDVGYDAGISAHAVGRIKGDVLETLEQGAEFERWYRRYVDRDGKSLFDRYTLRHRPDQDFKDYRLDRYEP